MQNRLIVLEDWGLIEYSQALSLQEERFSTLIAKREGDQVMTENHLIFCEHPSVYTLGKSGQEENMLLSLLELKKHNATFFKTNRGGDITYHGPGQLVIYPIFDLQNFNLGLREYIYRLEECVIKLLCLYGIKAGRLAGATGVWLDDVHPARKICAIGVKCSRYITMHGLACNINTDLDYFNYINPCGFTDKSVTSMAKELGYSLDMNKIKQEIELIFSGEFS